MEFLNKKTIKLSKALNELDTLVLKFLRILKKHTKYIIVSGYVAILFGRARGTEDVDIFIEKITKDQFSKLYQDLKREGFWCIVGEKESHLYEQLQDSLAIRFAKKGECLPNFEVKFAQTELDRQNLKNKKIKVLLSKGGLFISPIEQQIAYKEVVLKSNKDLEDAQHLREVFAGKLNNSKIKKFKELFKDE